MECYATHLRLWGDLRVCRILLLPRWPKLASWTTLASRGTREAINPQIMLISVYWLITYPNFFMGSPSKEVIARLEVDKTLSFFSNGLKNVSRMVTSIL